MRHHPSIKNQGMSKSNIFWDTAIFSVHANIFENDVAIFLLRVILRRFKDCYAIPRAGRINPCYVGEISPILVEVMCRLRKTTCNHPKTTCNGKKTTNIVNCLINYDCTRVNGTGPDTQWVSLLNYYE